MKQGSIVSIEDCNSINNCGEVEVDKLSPFLTGTCLQMYVLSSALFTLHNSKTLQKGESTQDFCGIKDLVYPNSPQDTLDIKDGKW